jgi:hypothetical protein
MTTFGEDTVQRKSLLEQNNMSEKKDYDKWYRVKFKRDPPVHIPTRDRQWVSPLGGVALPAGRKK